MGASSKTIIAMLIVVALVLGYWMLLLSPKREEANKLAAQADQVRASLAEAERQVADAEAAKREFPNDYRSLVVLGQAVPDNEETASLLVELNRIARRAKVSFKAIQLQSGSEGSGEASAGTTSSEAPEEATPEGSAAVPVASPVPPTEAAAALLPLGATIGPAGLGVMPYELTLSGDFFQIADFIERVDSLVHGAGAQVSAQGRLITIDGFSLSEDQEEGLPQLEASFTVTTYLTPPGQGTTVGATPTEPAPPGAVPAATETSESGAPAEEAAEPAEAAEASGESSTIANAR